VNLDQEIGRYRLQTAFPLIYSCGIGSLDWHLVRTGAAMQPNCEWVVYAA